MITIEIVAVGVGVLIIVILLVSIANMWKSLKDKFDGPAY